MNNYSQAVDVGDDLAKKIFYKNKGIRNILFESDFYSESIVLDS